MGFTDCLNKGHRRLTGIAVNLITTINYLNELS